MDENGTTMATTRKGPLFNEEELARLERARKASHRVVTTRPRSLGYPSVACLIINRMVGTGIFKTPTVLMQGTSSVGLSLIFWALGALVAMAGTFVFSEFGLTIPRLQVEGQGEKEPVPRNGGEKNYVRYSSNLVYAAQDSVLKLEYLCQKPQFLATCIYGIPFVVLGTAAGNAIIFAENVIRASEKEPTNNEVRGVAIAVITISCLVHTVWRRGGLYLNNFFVLVKVALLLMLFIVGIISAVRAIKGGDRGSVSVAKDNFNPKTSFENRAEGSYGYTEAFLAIIFAYEGFNQANYVLGEIDDPRRKFKPAAFTTVGLVGVLYLLVNISYMLVVPKSEQNRPRSDMSTSFFQRVFGETAASEVLYALVAFSSLGNVVVQTFTAARVKQEIAKEGVLPWSTFFGSNFDLRLFRRQTNSWAHAGETPAGAFGLHWVFGVLVILASFSQTPKEAYSTIVSVYAFTIDAIFGFLVGLGLLYLRIFEAHTKWSTKSTSTPWLSVCAAAIFMLGNLFPLVGIWIPPESGSSIVPMVEWFVTGTVGMGLVFAGFLWWLALYFVLPRIKGMQLEVEKEEVLDNGNGYWIMWHEIVRFNWIVR